MQKIRISKCVVINFSSLAHGTRGKLLYRRGIVLTTKPKVVMPSTTVWGQNPSIPHGIELSALTKPYWIQVCLVGLLSALTPSLNKQHLRV